MTQKEFDLYYARKIKESEHKRKRGEIVDSEKIQDEVSWKRSLIVKEYKVNLSRARKVHITSVTGYREQEVPFLRCSGKWLKACGFDTGTELKIICKEGELVITKA